MLHKLRSRAEDEKGFTLIELLVVILIIGILAAIAIPTFIGQKSKANDSAAESLARNAATAMETYSTDHDGSYVGANAAALNTIESSLNTTDATQAILTSATTGTATGYTIAAKSTSGTTFTLTNDNGASSYTCDKGGVGSCKGTAGSAGTW
jgi:type IV pilus assembly protein PilA